LRRRRELTAGPTNAADDEGRADEAGDALNR